MTSKRLDTVFCVNMWEILLSVTNYFWLSDILIFYGPIVFLASHILFGKNKYQATCKVFTMTLQNCHTTQQKVNVVCRCF